MRVLLSSRAAKTSRCSDELTVVAAAKLLEAGDEVFYLCTDGTRSPFSASFNFNEDRDWSGQLAAFCKAYNFCELHRNRYNEVHFFSAAKHNQVLEFLCNGVRPDVVVLAVGHQAGAKLVGKIKGWLPDCYLVGFRRKAVLTQGCDLVIAHDPEQAATATMVSPGRPTGKYSGDIASAVVTRLAEHRERLETGMVVNRACRN